MLGLVGLFVEPRGVLWGLFGLAPLFEHRGRDPVELGHLLWRAGVGGELDPMAVGVKEVDGLEDPVVGRAEDVEPLSFKLRLVCEKRLDTLHLKGDVLHPDRVCSSRPISGELGSSKKASTLPMPASRKTCM